MYDQEMKKLKTQQRIEKKKLSDQIKAQRAAQRKKLAEFETGLLDGGFSFFFICNLFAANIFIFFVKSLSIKNPNVTLEYVSVLILLV